MQICGWDKTVVVNILSILFSWFEIRNVENVKIHKAKTKLYITLCLIKETYTYNHAMLGLWNLHVLKHLIYADALERQDHFKS